MGLIQCCAHDQQLAGGGALRSNGGGLHLEAQAKLDDRHRVVSAALFMLAALEVAGPDGVDNEGANTTSSLYQTFRLQTRQGFAHHGSTDSALLGDDLFSRELGPRWQLAGENSPRQVEHQLLGQAQASIRSSAHHVTNPFNPDDGVIVPAALG
ncbi:hypothetical protein D3C73_1052010 [compost metagenome]